MANTALGHFTSFSLQDMANEVVAWEDSNTQTMHKLELMQNDLSTVEVMSQVISSSSTTDLPATNMQKITDFFKFAAESNPKKRKEVNQDDDTSECI